jgi:hypothetical protein
MSKQGKSRKSGEAPPPERFALVEIEGETIRINIASAKEKLDKFFDWLSSLHSERLETDFRTFFQQDIADLTELVETEDVVGIIVGHDNFDQYQFDYEVVYRGWSLDEALREYFELEPNEPMLGLVTLSYWDLEMGTPAEIDYASQGFKKLIEYRRG